MYAVKTMTPCHVVRSSLTELLKSINKWKYINTVAVCCKLHVQLRRKLHVLSECVEDQQ